MMPTGQTTGLDRLESLVEDVFRLRRIMAQNSQDMKDSREFSFIYFIDTPTFRLFAQPDVYSEAVAAIPELALDEGSDFPADDDANRRVPPRSAYRSAMFANALLTSEYIFQLASRNKHRKPVLVSSEHAAEIFAYISWLEGQSRNGFRRARQEGKDIYHTVRQRLERETAAFESGGIDPARWLERIRQLVVSLISEAACSEMLGPHRILRLLEKGAMANADHALAMDGSIISPPLEEIAKWRNRISAAKAGNKVTPSGNAIDADAVTLCQLALLNREWQETKVVHVLITSDRGLHRAYSQWKRDCEHRKPGHRIFYAIRDPRQYVPILNVNEMKSAYREADVFKKVGNSISTFIASFSSTDDGLGSEPDNNDPSALPGGRAIRKMIETRWKRHDNHHEVFERLIRQEIEQISAHWLEAVELSIAAKADVISELAQEETELWRSATWHSALKTNFNDQFTEVRTSFENLASTSTLLRHEIWALGQGRRKFDESPSNHRRLASDFSDFRHPAFQGRSLVDIIAGIHASGDASVEMMKLVASDQRTRKERLLITGCLSLEIGAWAGASSLLERARSNKPDHGPLASETIFFHSVARRLAATTANYSSEYERVRHDLEVLFQENEKNPRTIEGLRVRNELLALDLCQVAFMAFHQETPADLLETVLPRWQRMAEQYADRLGNPATDPLWQIMDKQFTLNSCNLLYWLDATGLKPLPALTGFVTRSLERIDRPDPTYLVDGTHGSLYPLLARYTLSGEGDRGTMRGEILLKLKSILSSDRTNGFSPDIPYVDKAEFIAIERRLMARRS